VYYSLPITKEAFQATIEHLQNLTTISVDTINAAMASAIVNNNRDDKTVHDFLKDLEQIKNKNQDQQNQQTMCS
jgi:hypothetical protein